MRKDPKTGNLSIYALPSDCGILHFFGTSFLLTIKKSWGRGGPVKEPYSQMARKGIERHKSLFSENQSVFCDNFTAEGVLLSRVFFYDSILVYLKFFINFVSYILKEKKGPDLVPEQKVCPRLS